MPTKKKCFAGGRTVQSYMDDISNHTRISPDEEKVLGRIIRGYLNEVPKVEDFEAVAEFNSALQEFNRGRYPAYEQAREKFILANLKLVAHEAFRRAKYGRLPISEMIQEGNIGLMRAVEKFDPERGFRFSTYATWWIKQAMTRATYSNKLIRIPVYRVEKQKHVRETFYELTRLFGREPTVVEIAEWLDRTVADVESVMAVPRDPVSLDIALSDERDSSRFGDMVEDESAIDPEQICIEQSLIDSVQNYLRMKVAQGRVSERDLQILEMRFGLGGDDPMSLDHIGKDVGLTRERVRQIINNTLARIRQNADIHFGSE